MDLNCSLGGSSNSTHRLFGGGLNNYTCTLCIVIGSIATRTSMTGTQFQHNSTLVHCFSIKHTKFMSLRYKLIQHSIKIRKMADESEILFERGSKLVIESTRFEGSVDPILSKKPSSKSNVGGNV